MRAGFLKDDTVGRVGVSHVAIPARFPTHARGASAGVPHPWRSVTRPGRGHGRLDEQIRERFEQHADAPILLSMPGFGVVLAAMFLANTGADLHAFETVDRLASLAGLAPAPRDSGRISGNHHRPKRFNRRLMRTCYLAALSSLKNSPASRAFYDRKRAEGKSHKQALIALARRRINVLWAMLRDRTTYQEPLPPALAPAA